MRRVGSREFKNRMGQYLRAVRHGETLVITDRGKPVAKVSLPNESEPEARGLMERMRELEAQGLIRIATKPLRSFRPVKSRGRPASQMIIEDRR